MKIKIQVPEEREKLPQVYILLLVTSFVMLSITLFFLVGFLVSRHA